MCALHFAAEREGHKQAFWRAAGGPQTGKKVDKTLATLVDDMVRDRYDKM
jgi:hypothetical protein